MMNYEQAIYMDGVLRRESSAELVSKVANESLEGGAARDWLLAELDEANGDAHWVSWPKQPHYSRLVAERIESLIIDGEVTRHLALVPIMIRVFAGGEALAGERFKWEPFGVEGGFRAVASDGTDWAIDPVGDRWEITIAMWDYADYRTTGLDRAKRIAEQIQAAPSATELDEAARKRREADSSDSNH
jgi:hypothetical protein